MQPFEAYQQYIALKSHFSSSAYDYHKYGGKIRANINSFHKRKDKYFFTKLADKYNTDELLGFLVANFVNSDSMWIGSAFSEKSETTYIEWKKKIESLPYVFKLEVEKLLNNCNHFNDLFECKEGQHPTLLRLALSNEISIETIVVLNKILNFFKQFDRDIDDDIIWPEFRNKCVYYEPFLNMDKKKYVLILKQMLDI